MTAAWQEKPDAPLMVNGAALEYACYGPAPGLAPTLVLLHEGLGCTALWRDVPRHLADVTGLGVMAYSRTGYGGSDPAALPRPLDYMTREATEILGGVLDAIGFREGLLMGHSDGATIATIYAGSVSDMRVRGLILIAPHFFTEAQGLATIRAMKTRFDQGPLRDKMARFHSDPDGAFKGWHDVWTDPKFQNWNVADCIDHLRIPVLAIQGRDDPYGTLAQIEEIESRIYAPLETEILPDCRHDPHLEHPQAFLKAVKDFTTRLNRLEREHVPLT